MAYDPECVFRKSLICALGQEYHDSVRRMCSSSLPHFVQPPWAHGHWGCEITEMRRDVCYGYFLAWGVIVHACSPVLTASISDDASHGGRAWRGALHVCDIYLRSVDGRVFSEDHWETGENLAREHEIRMNSSWTRILGGPGCFFRLRLELFF